MITRRSKLLLIGAGIATAGLAANALLVSWSLDAEFLQPFSLYAFLIGHWILLSPLIVSIALLSSLFDYYRFRKKHERPY